MQLDIVLESFPTCFRFCCCCILKISIIIESSNCCVPNFNYLYCCTATMTATPICSCKMLKFTLIGIFWISCLCEQANNLTRRERECEEATWILKLELWTFVRDDPRPESSWVYSPFLANILLIDNISGCYLISSNGNLKEDFRFTRRLSAEF